MLGRFGPGTRRAGGPGQVTGVVLPNNEPRNRKHHSGLSRDYS
jgi:hypothetical protein